MGYTSDEVNRRRKEIAIRKVNGCLLYTSEQNNVSFQNVKTGEPLSQKEIDEMFMRRCLQLAKNGRENAKPNPMVGAVIVSGDGRIIGEMCIRDRYCMICCNTSVLPREKSRPSKQG